jgi:hypothetical protein
MEDGGSYSTSFVDGVVVTIPLRSVQGFRLYIGYGCDLGVEGQFKFSGKNLTRSYDRRSNTSNSQRLVTIAA